MASASEIPRLLLSTQEVAQALGVSQRFIKQLIHAGSLPSFKVGRLRRIDARDLRAWIECQRAAGRPVGFDDEP